MNIQDFYYRENEITVITACLELVVFSNVPVEEGAKGFLKFYQEFRNRFGDEVKLYNTANMKNMKAIDSEILDMVPFWFSDQTGIPKGDIGIEMHSGKTSQDAVPPAFDMFCDRTSDEPNSYFRIVMPVNFFQSDPTSFLELIHSAISDFPLLSGYAGYSFFWQTRDPEVMETAVEYYKPWLKRHPGFVHGETMEFVETALFGIVTVDWLTLLGSMYTEKLGGAERISKDLDNDVDVFPLNNGVIIRAGSLPKIGDVNRNDSLVAYQKVSKYLKGLRAPAEEAWIEGFEPEETEEWFARFD